ncbi:MAG: Aldehyde dehydrogenase, partial [uncultured Nocardioides sp.]
GPPRRQEDLQALHRRRVPPLGVRPDLGGHRLQGQPAGQRRAGQPQGRPGRGARGPQGVRRLVLGHRVQPRAGRLPDGRGPRGPSRPVRRRAPRHRGHQLLQGQHLRRRGRRPPRLVRRLVGQDHPGRRHREPRRRTVLQHLLARADRCRRGGRPSRSAARADQRRGARHRDRQHLRRHRQRGPPAHGDHAGGGDGHLRPPRGRGQHAHRLGRGDRPLARVAHGRQRHRPDRCRRRRPGHLVGGRRGGQPQAGAPRPGGSRRLARHAGHRPADGLVGDQDGLAPDRPL